MANARFDGRRAFIKKLVAGTAAAAGVLLVYRRPTLSALAAAEGAEEGFDPGDHDYAFVVDVDKCIGCGYCVKACSIENDVPEGQFRTWIERYVVTTEGVYVDSPNGGMDGFGEVDEALQAKAINSFFVPKLCNHCAQAPCVQVCPVGATFNGPGGFVLVDSEHCIGCGYCIQACPYGVRFMNAENRVADKCTWCYHRVAGGKLPACVTVCPTEARVFGDLRDPDSKVSAVLQHDDWHVLKPHMHTKSKCLYVALPREVV